MCIKKLLSALLLNFCLLSGLPVFGQDLRSDLSAYLYELGIEEMTKYKFIVVYPVRHSMAIDQHWLDMMNARQPFREFLFVIVLDDPNERNLLSEYALQRPNLVFDKCRNYYKQSFYSYNPVYFEINGSIVKKIIHLNYKNAYWRKAELYQKYRSN